MIETLADHPGAAIVTDNEFPKSIELPADRLVNLIDPSAYVHPTAGLGRECVVYCNGFIGYNATLGNRVFALAGVTINHDDAGGDKGEINATSYPGQRLPRANAR